MRIFLSLTDFKDTHITKLITTFYLFIFSVSASALETDNFLAWKVELRSSKEEINQFLKQEIEAALRVQTRAMTCSQMVKKIAHRFESKLVHDNPIENHLFRTLASDQIYPQDIHYVAQSIFRDPFRVYIPAFGLAPNIQVEDFYFGTDKLSHFAWVGYLYYKRITLEAALAYGIQDEKTLHGYWASGVFSYSDLEANYQGFKFYDSLCDRYLMRNQDQWMLREEPNIADYVNGHWDESYYPSHFLPTNWKKVKPVLQKTYCSERLNPVTLERFQHYKEKSSLSPSMELLQKIPDLPQPQTWSCP